MIAKEDVFAKTVDRANYGSGNREREPGAGAAKKDYKSFTRNSSNRVRGSDGIGSEDRR
jgi:hypothetical protein